MKKVSVILMTLTVLCVSSVNAQSIRVCDEMYKKSIVRALDLRERQNQPMFSKNREITGLIVEAVKNKILTPYKNDSLNTAISIDEFMENLTILSTGPQYNINEPVDTVDLYLTYGEDWRILYGGGTEYFLSRDLYQMEIREDVVFDKQRSRMYYNIHAITLFIPADHPSNIKGIQLPVASFSFAELKENVFKDNPNAVWFNNQNDAEHKNLADAFELRLFSSYITKVSNANDQFLTDIYGGDQQKGIMASQSAAHDLLEFESNLWEY